MNSGRAARATPMDTSSGPQYQDALLRIEMLCELRRRNVPEEEVAEKLQFGSVEAMQVAPH